MTTRHYAHACAAAAVLLTAGSCSPALHTRWAGLALLLAGCLFAALARRCYDRARREQAVQQRLERLTVEDGDRFVPPPPCCSFWRHTDRQVHGPDCTRPAPAETTLTPRELQEFTRITAAFHQPGGAA
jgi:hypothetical protein